jgi:MFS superfamily sulfate permease-like transporter
MTIGCASVPEIRGVAWNMVEASAIVTLLRASLGDAAVLMITPLLTVFRDLTEAIVVGFALGSVLFIHRMSTARAIKVHVPFVDSTAAHMIEGLAHKADRRGARLVLTGTSHVMRRDRFVHGIKPPLVAYDVSIERAIQTVR